MGGYWPGSERAVWARTGMVMSRVKAMDFDAAVEVYERFLKTVGANDSRIRAVRERIEQLKGEDK